VTVTEAGVPALPNGTAFRTYIEHTGGIRSGLAIANPSSSSVTVTMELARLDGSSTGLSAAIVIPGNGQRAVFLNEIPGFTTLPAPFQGVWRLTATAPVALASLRGRLNERGEFLVTTTTPVDESRPPTSTELLFPHFAEGGGYSMQFVLFGRVSSGTIYLFDRTGQPVNLLFR
jgi:hypothetical protein